MSRRNAEPAIILRNTTRGIAPTTGFDAELVGRLRLNMDLHVCPELDDQTIPYTRYSDGLLARRLASASLNYTNRTTTQLRSLARALG